MHKDLQKVYRMLHDAFEEVAKLEVTVMPQITASRDKEELADAAYACSEIEKLSVEIKKRIVETKETAMQLACAIAAISMDGDTIKTPYVTATPQLRQIATLPSRTKDPDGYAALMNHLGVPESLWKGGDHAAVQPHWPGMMDYVNALAAEGKPMPPGVDPSKTYAEYKLLLRGKMEPDAPSDAPAREPATTDESRF